jgi:hypothetical protein
VSVFSSQRSRSWNAAASASTTSSSREAKW